MNSIDTRLRNYVFILITVIVIGLIGLIVLENFTPFDAVYFLIVTIATARYVDLSPVTTAGKILVIFIILTGVG